MLRRFVKLTNFTFARAFQCEANPIRCVKWVNIFKTEMTIKNTVIQTNILR